MKFTSNNTNAIFCEQVETVSDFFEKWSDCERTVVIYALLKRLPYSCLKFMQSTIEQTFSQCTCNEQIQLMEQQSNNKSYITELCDQYKSLTNNGDVQMNKDSVYTESDRLIIGDNTNLNLHNNNNNNINFTDKFNKKDDILNDILNFMPMLKIGNDETKQVYLSLIPFMVEDARRGVVNTLIVQQILSFLLIHPALSAEDRRSLNHYIRYLEDHIINRIQAEQSINNSWQTIAPPGVLQSSSSLSSASSSHKSHQLHFKSNENLWDTQSIHVSQDFNEADGSGGGSTDLFQAIDISSSKNSGSGASQHSNGMFELGAGGGDDHHVSFSKNGTEILDFDPDNERSNTQIGFSAMSAISDFLTVPSVLDHGILKTRRSNSLTTGTMHHDYLSAALTASTDNLANALHKPRSFSLSIESPRSSVTSSGSETRLDDFKPSYQSFQTVQVGMSNIASWLKSLRLHKYVWIFASFSYDQMMEITEDYLSKLEVTKGARHKLVLCIQKLKERYNLLIQLEKSLMSGATTLNAALEELSNIVITPIKPIEFYNKEDVAAQFLKVLELICNMITAKQITPHDEEVVNSLVWILEKCVHNEAFVTHTNQLKDYRFRVSKLRMKFPPKNHYSKNGSTNNGTNVNKTRWSSVPKSHNKCANDAKSLRKNSNPMANFSFVNSSGGNGGVSNINNSINSNNNNKQNKPIFAVPNSNYHSTNSSGYNKSSSYPNFSSSTNMQHGSQHHSYHRHSVSNLITITPSQTTESIVTPSAPIAQQKSANCIGLMSSVTKTTASAVASSHNKNSHTSMTKHSQNNNNNNISILNHNNSQHHNMGLRSNSIALTGSKHSHTKNVIGDINSRLEFLCLQMTEQAIN